MNYEEYEKFIEEQVEKERSRHLPTEHSTSITTNVQSEPSFAPLLYLPIPLPTHPTYFMPPTSNSLHVPQQEMKFHQLSQLHHLQYGSRSSLAPVDTSSQKSADNPIRLEGALATHQAQPAVGPHAIAKNTPLFAPSCCILL